MLLTAELAAHLQTAHLEAHLTQHPMPTVIRPATPHDLTELLVLERDTPTAPHWPTADYKAILEQAAGQTLRRHLLVATEGPAVTGFAVIRALGHGPQTEAEIESVVVHAQARRQGLGTGLCRALLRWAHGEGAPAVTLEVRARSTGAIHLYTGLGFITTGRRAGYYQHPPDDALLMRCALQQTPGQPARQAGLTGWLDI